MQFLHQSQVLSSTWDWEMETDETLCIISSKHSSLSLIYVLCPRTEIFCYISSGTKDGGSFMDLKVLSTHVWEAN